MLDIGHWMLDVGCCVTDNGLRMPGEKMIFFVANYEICVYIFLKQWGCKLYSYEEFHENMVGWPAVYYNRIRIGHLIIIGWNNAAHHSKIK